MPRERHQEQQRARELRSEHSQRPGSSFLNTVRPEFCRSALRFGRGKSGGSRLQRFEDGACRRRGSVAQR